MCLQLYIETIKLLLKWLCKASSHRLIGKRALTWETSDNECLSVNDLKSQRSEESLTFVTTVLQTVSSANDVVHERWGILAKGHNAFCETSLRTSSSLPLSRIDVTCLVSDRSTGLSLRRTQRDRVSLFSCFKLFDWQHQNEDSEARSLSRNFSISYNDSSCPAIDNAERRSVCTLK